MIGRVFRDEKGIYIYIYLYICSQFFFLLYTCFYINCIVRLHLARLALILFVLFYLFFGLLVSLSIIPLPFHDIPN